MKPAGKTEAQQLESFIIKQLLTSSGVFKGNGAAGSSLTADLFADTLSEAIATSGGLGLSELITPGAAHAATTEASLALPHRAPTSPAAPHAFDHQTSAFGARLDPITGRPSEHHGVDLAAPEGTPIPAAKDGTVIRTGARGGYGQAIELAHADGTSTLYAHTSGIAVAEGDVVRAGEVIGYVGQTGRTTGPHLHLEVRRGGSFIDPGVALKAYRLRAEESGGGSP